MNMKEERQDERTVKALESIAEFLEKISDELKDIKSILRRNS